MAALFLEGYFCRSAEWEIFLTCVFFGIVGMFYHMYLKPVILYSFGFYVLAN